MHKQYLKQIVLAISLTSLSFVANATPVDTAAPAIDNYHSIYAKDFVAGQSTYKTTFLQDIDATFTAKVTKSNGKLTDGVFSKKGDQSSEDYQGVGVSSKSGSNISDRTPGEIDIGEFINAKFTKNGTTDSAGIIITSFTLGLLFDGPEYNDVNEVAQITATLLDGSPDLVYTFTAKSLQSGLWTGQGSFANLSPAADGRGAVWVFSNPFGDARISGLSFTALTGKKGTGAGTNQSDYTLISISAVPEPETYAMMLAGLAGIGFVARKKKQA